MIIAAVLAKFAIFSTLSIPVFASGSSATTVNPIPDPTKPKDARMMPTDEEKSKPGVVEDPVERARLQATKLVVDALKSADDMARNRYTSKEDLLKYVNDPTCTIGIHSPADMAIFAMKAIVENGPLKNAFLCAHKIFEENKAAESRRIDTSLKTSNGQIADSKKVLLTEMKRLFTKEGEQKLFTACIEERNLTADNQDLQMASSISDQKNDFTMFKNALKSVQEKSKVQVEKCAAFREIFKRRVNAIIEDEKRGPLKKLVTAFASEDFSPEQCREALKGTDTCRNLVDLLQSSPAARYFLHHYTDATNGKIECKVGLLKDSTAFDHLRHELLWAIKKIQENALLELCRNPYIKKLEKSILEGEGDAPEVKGAVQGKEPNKDDRKHVQDAISALKNAFYEHVQKHQKSESQPEHCIVPLFKLMDSLEEHRNLQTQKYSLQAQLVRTQNGNKNILPRLASHHHKAPDKFFDIFSTSLVMYPPVELVGRYTPATLWYNIYRQFEELKKKTPAESTLKDGLNDLYYDAAYLGPEKYDFMLTASMQSALHYGTKRGKPFTFVQVLTVPPLMFMTLPAQKPFIRSDLGRVVSMHDFACPLLKSREYFYRVIIYEMQGLDAMKDALSKKETSRLQELRKVHEERCDLQAKLMDLLIEAYLKVYPQDNDAKDVKEGQEETRTELEIAKLISEAKKKCTKDLTEGLDLRLLEDSLDAFFRREEGKFFDPQGHKVLPIVAARLRAREIFKLNAINVQTGRALQFKSINALWLDGGDFRGQELPFRIAPGQHIHDPRLERNIAAAKAKQLANNEAYLRSHRHLRIFMWSLLTVEVLGLVALYIAYWHGRSILRRFRPRRRRTSS